MEVRQHSAPGAAPSLQLAATGYLHLGNLDGIPFGRVATEPATRLAINGRTVLFIDHRRCPDQLARAEIWKPSSPNEGRTFFVLVAYDAAPSRAIDPHTGSLTELLRHASRSRLACTG